MGKELWTWHAYEAMKMYADKGFQITLNSNFNNFYIIGIYLQRNWLECIKVLEMWSPWRDIGLVSQNFLDTIINMEVFIY